MLDASDYTPERTREIHTAAAASKLVGRTIVGFAYMKAVDTGFYHDAPILELDNGDFLLIQSDDEGNDAGSIRLISVAGPNTSMTIPRI